MFHPVGHPLDRGWVGRADGERIVHLAAQTLQSLFTGGGSAREHAEYALGEVVLLAPVLHPPSVRVFDDDGTFAFANPAAIVGPGASVTNGTRALSVLTRPAAVIGAEGVIAGFTILADWRARGVRAPKDRDFALGLGPLVVTADEVSPTDFDWSAAIALAASGTTLSPGDVVAGPILESHDVEPGAIVRLEVDGVGVLEQRVGDR
jgi:hypothetical protein